ncbi:MAG: T9SS type A sorting domain-containing protein [Bacteroidia bacterium]
MKTKLLLSYLLLQVFFIKGQNTFHYFYNTNTGAQNITLTSKEDFLVTGRLEMDTINAIYAQYLSKFDKFGNNKWTKTFNWTSPISSEGWYVNELSSNSYIDFSLLFNGSNSKRSFMMLKIDSMGNVLKDRQIDSIMNYDFFKLRIRNSNSYYFAGTWYPGYGYKQDIFIFETDSDLNIKWAKQYDFPSNSFTHDDFVFTDFIFANNKIMLTAYGYAVNNGADGVQSTIIVLDTTGNLINCKTTKVPPSMPGRSQVVRLYNILQYDRNDLYFFGGYATDGVDYGMNNMILKTDSSLNVKWVKTFAINNKESVIYNSLITSDKNLAVLFGYDPAGTSNSQGRGSVLLKMDTAANIKWMHLLNDTTYGVNNNYVSSFGASNFIETLDLGLAIIGECDGSSSGSNWKRTELIKTDSFGNQPCDYGVVNYYNTTNTLPFVPSFPVVTSINSLVTSTPTINTQHIILTQVDFCSYTGIEKYSSSLDFKIYPNPSSGNFAISIVNNTNDRVNIEIQDITGRSLITQQLQTNNGVAEIQTNLASGIYLAIVTNNGKTIKQKLIINN